MKRRSIAFLTTFACCLLAQGVRGADILYDTLNRPVDRDGNFSDGYWLAMSFRTSDHSYMLDSVSILLRNPNFLTSGTIQFALFDTSGGNGLPGQPIDESLGSVSIGAISTNSYEEVKLTGLNRAVETSTNYWIVIASIGMSSTYFIGATQDTGGMTAGSLGFTMSVNLGLDWNAASTDYFAIGQIVAVPEPSAMRFGSLAGGLAISILAFRKRRARA